MHPDKEARGGLENMILLARKLSHPKLVDFFPSEFLEALTGGIRRGAEIALKEFTLERAFTGYISKEYKDLRTKVTVVARLTQDRSVQRQGHTIVLEEVFQTVARDIDRTSIADKPLDFNGWCRLQEVASNATEGELGLERARFCTKKLAHHDLTSSVPNIYKEALIVSIHRIAEIALEKFVLGPERVAETGERYEMALTEVRQISLLTSLELMADELYAGHEDTLSDVWVAATCLLGRPEPKKLVLEGDLVSISFSELYGPFSCEDLQCNPRRQTFTIYVSLSEYNAMPYKEGSGEMPKWVFGKRLGRALCEKHAPALKEGVCA